MRCKGVIAVHGGAGKPPSSKKECETRLEGIREALSSGHAVLQKNGSSLDAVEAAVVALEDNPAFNAGYGSYLTLEGKVEMDASIMDGKSLSAGAVALLTRMRNPIIVARLVMERTPHVFLAGKSAEQLATRHHLQVRNPLTEQRWTQYQHRLAKYRQDRTSKNADRSLTISTHDTVGAVALDSSGNVAAATSTGGTWLKLRGRIGDTPIIGAGTYASNEGGACSGTGEGEAAIRMCTAKMTVDFMEDGKNAQLACGEAIRKMSRTIPLPFGVIAVDTKGGIGAAHSSKSMSWGYRRVGERQSHTRNNGRRISLSSGAKT